MSATNLANGMVDDLFFPADYGAEIQLEVLRSDDRQALRDRLTELRAVPREQWESRGVLDLAPRQPGKYGVFFGHDGIAWVIPEVDGRFCVDALGSQKVLAEFERQAREEDDVSEAAAEEARIGGN